jgi:hypothetical protein
LKQKISDRLPSRGQSLPIFSLIVFIVFTWTLYNLLYQIPSWLFYMNIWNLLAVTAYVLSFALIESTLIMALVLLSCMLFPARYFKNKFTAQGSLQVLLLSAMAFALRENIQSFPKLDQWVMLVIPVAVLSVLAISVIVFSWIFDRFQILVRLLTAVTDRMVIFTYLYIPAGLVSLVVVLMRNIT